MTQAVEVIVIAMFYLLVVVNQLMLKKSQKTVLELIKALKIADLAFDDLARDSFDSKQLELKKQYYVELAKAKHSVYEELQKRGLN